MNQALIDSKFAIALLEIRKEAMQYHNMLVRHRKAPGFPRIIDDFKVHPYAENDTNVSCVVLVRGSNVLYRCRYNGIKGEATVWQYRLDDHHDRTFTGLTTL